jgi:hypothetical protein
LKAGTGGGLISNILDAPSQISLFGKLKLTNCAPIPGLPAIGFFMRQSVEPPARETAPGFFICGIAKGAS